MKRLQLIDGLRGIAVIGVIWHHLTEPIIAPGWHAFRYGPFTIFPLTFLTNGWTGVSLFFVLSGFVLVLPYLHATRPMENYRDVLRFYRRRAIRLLPLYFFMLVFSSVFLVKPDVSSMLLMVTFTFIVVPALFFPFYNWVLWSLAVEVWLSVLFPLLFAASRRFGMLKVFAVTVLIGVMTRWIGFSLIGYAGDHVIIDSVAAYVFAFVAGMMLAKHHVKRDWSAGYTLLLVGIVCIGQAFILLDYQRLHLLQPVWELFPEVFLVAGLFLCISFLLGHPRSLLTKIVSVPPLRWIGRMCYSFYVWHAALILMINPMQSRENFVLYFLLLPIVSFISFHLIENIGIWKTARTWPAAIRRWMAWALAGV